MTGWTGHRVESIRADLLDTRDRILGDLGQVEGGSLEASIYARIRTGGRLSVVAPDVPWLSRRIKLWYICEGMPDVALGVFIPASPKVSTRDGVEVRDLELYDKLLVLDQQLTTTSVSFPAGTVVTTAVRTVIGWSGETNLAVTDSTETLRQPMAWEVGTPLLTIANALLDALGFFSLWCDGDGKYVASPYIAPSARPVAWAFDGADAVYLPDYDTDADYYSVPNRLTAVSKSAPDTAALVATATDTDSPLGYTARGRWVDATVTDVDATSQAVLAAIAARKLADAQQVTVTDEIEHPLLPIGLNNVVTRSGIRAVVTKQAIDLTLPGVLVRSTLRRLT